VPDKPSVGLRALFCLNGKHDELTANAFHAAFDQAAQVQTRILYKTVVHSPFLQHSQARSDPSEFANSLNVTASSFN
jgi:hypothetical protein